MTTFVGMMRARYHAWICQLAVCLLFVSASGTASASRFPRLLKNVGVQVGPLWGLGAHTPGSVWEVGFDHFVRVQGRRRAFLGLGIGRQDGLADRSAIWSLRLSLSPYQLQIDRRWRFITMASLRLNRWSTPAGATDCVRPEIGFQVMRLNNLFSPKLAVGYGRELRIGGAVEQPVAPASSETFTVQIGVSLNLATLSGWRRAKRRAENAADPG